jgi:glucokinase
MTCWPTCATRWIDHPVTPAAGRIAIAADIGGSKFAAGVVDRSGAVLGSHRVPTPQSADPDTLFDALTAAIDGALADAGTAAGDAALTPAIGVGTAAPMDLGLGTVSPVNIPGWRGFPLRERLSSRYDRDVGMIGDAVAVAVAEHWLGAAKGSDNVLGMVVSTGVGGGLVLGGCVFAGATGNAGHIGHVSVDPNGPACVCGGVGCLEAIASGPSIAAWARERGLEAPGAREVAALAERGNPIATAAYERAAEALGLAVAGAVTLLDLDMVVIGGGVAGAGSVLFEPLATSYARYATLSFASAPRIRPAALGAGAGLVGAAAVALLPEVYWPGGRKGDSW